VLTREAVPATSPAATAVEVEVRIVEITVSNPKYSNQRLRDMINGHSPMSDWSLGGDCSLIH
jgi:hypothetical protein